MADDWKDQPVLGNIDREKLQMLQNLAEQGDGKSPSDLLPYLLQAASDGQKKGMHFNSQEISAVIQAMKIGKSEAQAARIDRIVQLMKMMNR